MSAPTPIITGGDSPVTIPAGDIVFYDCFAPPLLSGAYTVNAKQTITGVDDGPAPYQQSQAINISGPRFNLVATDISSRYPPANAVGKFPDHLPHVVLNQRSTPWSRSIVDPTYTPAQPSAPANTPWLALLNFYSADLQVPGNQLPPNPNAPVASPATGLVSDVFTKNNTNVLVPQIVPTAAEQQQQVVTIDVDYAFFLTIAPSQTDLPYLAHGRQVNTTGKALGGDPAQGFFALAVGNRVVNSGDFNLPVLVSLEGHWNRLPGGSDATNPIYRTYKIRLVVLASWNFQAAASDGDFLGLMAALTASPSGTAMLALPATGSTQNPDTDPAAQAVQALALGYTPLPYDLRIGETTTAFFRGPAAAVPCATDTTYGPYYYSDGAIYYDSFFGTFNLSYAAAFQMGRLLALSDGSFATRLVQWRNDYFYRVQHTAQKQQVNGAMAQAVARAAPADSPPAEDYGPPDDMPSIARRLWHANIAAPILNGDAKIPSVRVRQARTSSDVHPGILSPAEIDALHAAGEDPVAAIQSRLATRQAPPRSSP